MRVLVCGDREWTSEKLIYKRLKEFARGETVIIHGCARGADTMAGQIARFLGFEVEEYPAEWETYGPAAGPIRNRKMLKCGKPDLVIAFHNDIVVSKGTKDMVTIARQAGIPVEVIHE